MESDTAEPAAGANAAFLDPVMEHRWGQRILCNARVRISGGAAAVGTGRMRNVSMSGAFIETAVPLPLFAPIAIAVIRESGVDEAELSGCVVRCDPGGVAVEWTDILPGPVCPLLGCKDPCTIARDTSPTGGSK